MTRKTDKGEILSAAKAPKKDGKDNPYVDVFDPDRRHDHAALSGVDAFGKKDRSKHKPLYHWWE